MKLCVLIIKFIMNKYQILLFVDKPIVISLSTNIKYNTSSILNSITHI